ncbi:unnamed protein product [Leptidea sinapis]|uniref:Uncharacterized protein n=1 Tax=Leptidea sinapis TaxID=189913 RepID=A0A5E4QNT7_9NEOP|nr:unnamed protein product [Leptidea sinapis]
MNHIKVITRLPVVTQVLDMEPLPKAKAGGAWKFPRKRRRSNTDADGDTPNGPSTNGNLNTESSITEEEKSKTDQEPLGPYSRENIVGRKKIKPSDDGTR